MINNEKGVKAFEALQPTYTNLAQKVSNLIAEVLKNADVNYHAITNRAKGIVSLSKKIENPKYEGSIEKITDLAGVRVIAYVEDDVNKICEVVKTIFDIDPTNSIDKSDELGVDRVGYKSVHFVCQFLKDRIRMPEYSRFEGLKFEIQVRTILQHSWAEIEHDKNYKFSGELPFEIKRRFKLLAGALEMFDREFNMISREIDEYSNDVKVKTEKGELDILLDSISLKTFIISKFHRQIELKQIQNEFYSPESEFQVLQELSLFGVKTLADLGNLITEEVSSIFDKINNQNFPLDQLLPMVMLIFDSEKYFESTYKKYNKVRYPLRASSAIFLMEVFSEFLKIDENYMKYRSKYR